MIEITLALIVGVFVGYVLNGILSRNTTEEQLQAAYEKGKADEKQRILDEIHKKYGIPSDEPKEV